LNQIALADVEPMTDWHSVSSAPLDWELQLSVIERGEVHALVFSCRRTLSGWMNASSGSAVFVDPTHWREWHIH
jgi:hypothetical protein